MPIEPFHVGRQRCARPFLPTTGSEPAFAKTWQYGTIDLRILFCYTLSSPYEIGWTPASRTSAYFALHCFTFGWGWTVKCASHRDLRTPVVNRISQAAANTSDQIRLVWRERSARGRLHAALRIPLIVVRRKRSSAVRTAKSGENRRASA